MSQTFTDTTVYLLRYRSYLLFIKINYVNIRTLISKKSRPEEREKQRDSKLSIACLENISNALNYSTIRRSVTLGYVIHKHANKLTTFPSYTPVYTIYTYLQ